MGANWSEIEFLPGSRAMALSLLPMATDKEAAETGNAPVWNHGQGLLPEEDQAGDEAE